MILDVIRRRNANARCTYEPITIRHVFSRRAVSRLILRSPTYAEWGHFDLNAGSSTTVISPPTKTFRITKRRGRAWRHRSTTNQVDGATTRTVGFANISRLSLPWPKDEHRIVRPWRRMLAPSIFGKIELGRCENGPRFDTDDILLLRINADDDPRNRDKDSEHMPPRSTLSDNTLDADQRCPPATQLNVAIHQEKNAFHAQSRARFIHGCEDDALAAIKSIHGQNGYEWPIRDQESVPVGRNTRVSPVA